MNNSQLDFKFKSNNNKKYKIDNIKNNIVYFIKLAKKLLRLYYLFL